MRPHPSVVTLRQAITLTLVLGLGLLAGCAHRRKSVFPNGTGSEIRVEGPVVSSNASASPRAGDAGRSTASRPVADEPEREVASPAGSQD